ncbi:PREDICTED: uncharacterized protein LOC105129916 [Populus euphratica]|uniref:Uncharacterized protein LOC105129916 n=1 Tax=Populus euphratica TaxID=75702 RepID=A0AAJ6UIF0_POPEU|nr:PREDICTED: uncharacterized protein LOC105129916 [Populus euphratica]
MRPYGPRCTWIVSLSPCRFLHGIEPLFAVIFDCMAGFGWSLRHGHGSKRPLTPSQIACRICDHVFSSTQALISHIESHTVEERTALRRQNGLSLFSSSHAEPFASPFSFSLSTPTRRPQTGPLGRNRYNFPSSAERKHVFSDRRTPQNLVSGAKPFTPRAQLSRVPRNNKYASVGSQHIPLTFQAQPRVIDEPRDIHFTKPFLQQLERPFSSKARFQESNGHRRSKSHVETLDLTLKL